MLWRLKWRVSGVLANFVHVVLYDEGHNAPTTTELLLVPAIAWLLAAGAVAGTDAAIAANVGLAGHALLLMVGIFGVLATFATIGAAWCLVDRHVRTPPRGVKL